MVCWPKAIGATLVAMSLLSATATVAAPKPEHCAVFNEDVDGVFDRLDRLAAARFARSEPAFYTFRREGYRELSRSLAARRASHRAHVQAVAEFEVRKKTDPASVRPERLEPAVCFDLARMQGRGEPGDASPAGQKASQELLALLKQDIKSDLPSEEGARPKIWNGTPVGACENLDAVAILDQGSKTICSGLLVDRRTVLTAAHCVCALRGGGGTVVMGETVDRSSVEPVRRRSEASFEASDIRTPMEDPCVSSEKRRGVDIALLRLARDLTPDNFCRLKKIKETAGIAPVAAILDPAVSTVRVAGFGRTEQGTLGDKLYAHVGVYSRICGPEPVHYRYRCVPGRETMLYDPAGLRDTCGGDSGGPVYMLRNGALLAYAITSRGLPDGDCGSGGIYTLITPAVVAWMRRNGVDVDVRD